MTEILNIKPSIITPDRIIEIEIEHNGYLYAGFLIKKQKFEVNNGANFN